MSLRKILVFVMAELASTAAYSAPCENSEPAQMVVKNYLTAMQEHRFADAFPFLSSAMTDGKPVGEWAAVQKLFYQGGEVNILSMDIRRGVSADDSTGCELKQIVPNVLVSRDKFNNQGTTEFEVYTVVRDGERWLLDSQETLFEQSEVDVWFPGEKMPEFRDQY